MQAMVNVCSGSAMVTRHSEICRTNRSSCHVQQRSVD
jgi:hypothetical protein